MKTCCPILVATKYPAARCEKNGLIKVRLENESTIELCWQHYRVFWTGEIMLLADSNKILRRRRIK